MACFFFNDTATTEIYTYYTLFPYTTLFRSQHVAAGRQRVLHRLPRRAVVVAEHLGVLQQLAPRSEEHTSELQSLMRISYAVFCLKKKKKIDTHINIKHEYKPHSHHTRTQP